MDGQNRRTHGESGYGYVAGGRGAGDTGSRLVAVYGRRWSRGYAQPGLYQRL